MVRVEGPGTALDFNPSKTQGARPEVGGKSPAELLREPIKELAGEAGDKGSSFKPLGKKDIEEAVEISNKAMELGNFGLEFKIHEASGRVQVKVVDTKTKEVIREVPPQQMLDIAAQIKEMFSNMHEMVGVLVNELV